VALASGRLPPPLFEHSRNVADYCAQLAGLWQAPVEDAWLAGMLHDYCRGLPASQLLRRCDELGVPVAPLERSRPVQLLHARLAAAELADRGLSAACLDAIARHTVGGAGMSVLAKCLYVADTAAPGRTYEGVEELRTTAQESLEAATLLSVARTVAHLVKKRQPIHPDTVALYNEMVG
jgi:predicted HD superfamily hydrolase involved in NAD metabolism